MYDFRAFKKLSNEILLSFYLMFFKKLGGSQISDIDSYRVLGTPVFLHGIHVKSNHSSEGTIITATLASSHLLFSPIWKARGSSLLAIIQVLSSI